MISLLCRFFKQDIQSVPNNSPNVSQQVVENAKRGSCKTDLSTASQVYTGDNKKHPNISGVSVATSHYVQFKNIEHALKMNSCATVQEVIFVQSAKKELVYAQFDLPSETGKIRIALLLPSSLIISFSEQDLSSNQEISTKETLADLGYPIEKRNRLDKIQTCGLVALTNPNIKDARLLQESTIYLNTLYGTDDIADRGQEKIETLKGYLKQVIQCLRSGSFDDAKDPYLKRFAVQTSLLEPLKTSPAMCVDSLERYFNSIELEKKLASDPCLNEQAYFAIRRDVSGARHAIDHGAVMVGISLKEIACLEREYPCLQYMRESVEDCIGLSNDLLSRNSEKKAEIKKRQASFNLVDILLKDTQNKDLVGSFKRVQELHNKGIMTYFSYKKHLPEGFDQIEKLNKYLNILEGWLCHPYWALVGSPRYNPGLPVKEAASNLFLLRDLLTKFSHETN